MTPTFSLMSHFGIESEYMIVGRESLQVKPIADVILTELNGGELTTEVECGPVTWSNELVNHVLEIKFTNPSDDLMGWDHEFHKAIQSMNSLLDKHACVLLPTAMHPLMDPETETKLWAHGQKEIYRTYDRIFGCKGHGWSNLQSVHINLSYGSETEFVELHSAIRGVLPVILFLSASSPICEGKAADSLDARLSYYEANQKAIPIIAGEIIPELVQSFSDYQEIYKRIYAALKTHDPDGIIQHPWVNSRGAIPKFEYNAIEIRIMDIQESSYMDFCLIYLFTSLIRWLLNEPEALLKVNNMSTESLRRIYKEGRQKSPGLVPAEYAEVFGLKRENITYAEFCAELFGLCRADIPSRYHEGLLVILKQGNLARRLLASDSDILKTYSLLTETLSQNRYYEPNLN